MFGGCASLSNIPESLTLSKEQGKKSAKTKAAV